MNCRPDDLAYIVGHTLHTTLNGRIVRVVRRVVPGERITLPCGEVIKVRQDRTADWLIEASLPMPYTIGYSIEDAETIMTTIRPIADRHLRPIRGQEGQDQTLTWAGLPGRVEAGA